MLVGSVHICTLIQKTEPNQSQVDPKNFKPMLRNQRFPPAFQKKKHLQFINFRYLISPISHSYLSSNTSTFSKSSSSEFSNGPIGTISASIVMTASADGLDCFSRQKQEAILFTMCKTKADWVSLLRQGRNTHPET